MKGKYAAFALLSALALPLAAAADAGPFKGRTDAVGANCRGNTYFDIEVAIVGDKAEGTFQGSAFRNPVKFSGSASATEFKASHSFANLNNLTVVIGGTRIDDGSWNLTTVWAGGGASNCESKGVGKKA
jgi:hypothetical protein